MEKGKTNNPNGRPKGVANKISSILREALATNMQTHVKNLHSLIEEIEEPKDKVDAISKILPYILPKLNSLTIEDDSELTIRQPPKITIKKRSDGE